MEKTCKHCSKQFHPKTATQKYCSKKCCDNGGHPPKPKVEKICLYCGKKFMSCIDRQKCCSYDCQWRNRQEAKPRIINCKMCGKEVMAKKSTRKYCSGLCAKKFHYKHKRIPHYRECLECGKRIRVSPSRLKYNNYCSKECHLNNMKKNAGKEICQVCGKEYLCSKSQKKLRGRKTCSKECQSILITSLAKKRWEGHHSNRAIIRRIRYSKDMNNWRWAVFERDDYTCQMCGKKGGYLEADHIKPFAQHPELRFDIRNGRTLCRPCHQKTPTWGNRKRGLRDHV